MVYIDPADLGWRPYVKTWLESKEAFRKETKVINHTASRLCLNATLGLPT